MKKKNNNLTPFVFLLAFIIICMILVNIQGSKINELTINEMVPTLFILQTTSYEKFMIYCFDTKEFNPQTINVEYEYVAIAYDEDNNNLLIYEFYLK